jgi:S-adenosylmethionine synthetase
MEIIEYKSPGHPDTLTDLVVEECATFLDYYYKENYGKILHYNVDKALLSAGDCDIYYGGGTVKEVPTFILGGQATNLDNVLKSC